MIYPRRACQRRQSGLTNNLDLPEEGDYSRKCNAMRLF
jgi:hypothetical protein